MKKLILLVTLLVAGALLGYQILGLPKTVKAVGVPSIRLTSMCKENENMGLMRFREETSGVSHITWRAKIAGGSYFQTGEIKLGETAFFDAPNGTVVVDWYMTENTAISGSTVKAQNTKTCTFITICLDGVTQDKWIEDKGIPEGATRGECVVEETVTDICANIDGIQTGIPEGQHLDASGLNCVNFELGGAPAPAEVTSTPAVLGASTMARTGAVEENIFNLVFALGSLLSAFGIRKFTSSRVK